MNQPAGFESSTIYVPVLVEGDTIWRPAPAHRLRPGVYRIGRPEDYDPEYENWRFAPGDAVLCEMALLDDGDYLVAVEKMAFG